mmetsp:Transcript_31727/g.97122  ORF Transcript_31727/g.97122 Transcript_31727/m.97122 type:complete len:139 (+) Transcript_31727:995-1411(+)|eukprot:scaffold195676_cov23-Tisochrysis_lutea.AAC.1
MQAAVVPALCGRATSEALRPRRARKASAPLLKVNAERDVETSFPPPTSHSRIRRQSGSYENRAAMMMVLEYSRPKVSDARCVANCLLRARLAVSPSVVVGPMFKSAQQARRAHAASALVKEKRDATKRSLATLRDGGL